MSHSCSSQIIEFSVFTLLLTSSLIKLSSSEEVEESTSILPVVDSLVCNCTEGLESSCPDRTACDTTDEIECNCTGEPECDCSDATAPECTDKTPCNPADETESDPAPRITMGGRGFAGLRHAKKKLQQAKAKLKSRGRG